MQAIIVTGGKQYKVAEGDTIFVEKLPNEAGDAIVFDQVLAVIDGEEGHLRHPRGVRRQGGRFRGEER